MILIARATFHEPWTIHQHIAKSYSSDTRKENKEQFNNLGWELLSPIYDVDKARTYLFRLTDYKGAYCDRDRDPAGLSSCTFNHRPLSSHWDVDEVDKDAIVARRPNSLVWSTHARYHLPFHQDRCTSGSPRSWFFVRIDLSHYLQPSQLQQYHLH